MEKVQIIPPPRDVDPRVLCWKGGAVLGKMEAAADLWVQRAEWVRGARVSFCAIHAEADAIQDVLGMRALKERSFFL